MSLIPMYIFGAIFIAFASMEFKGICRVQKKSVLHFIKFMAWVSAIRIAMHYILGTGPASSDASDTMNKLHFINLLGVYWEDAVFTMPAIIAERMGASKFLRGLILAVSALAFASGHIAYGLPWAAITLFYVPFISYRYGRKVGLGTVMVCHILYDVITLLSFLLMGL